MTWLGTTSCDICKKEIQDFLIDGKTSSGPWAVMCPSCFAIHGKGLGLGKGQIYQKNEDGDFVSVSGNP